MEDHRRNLLNGTAPRSNCSQCSVPESQGMTSIRKQLLSKPWSSDQKQIKLLDVFFGNTCNLGCVMCGPEWSSFISNERYKVGLTDHQIKYKDNIDIALDTIDRLPDLISVSFVGGEFFLVNDNLKILEKIKHRGITATIMTNATIINQLLIDSLKEIKDVEIRISIDGIESCFEFIRYPASWDTWQKNVEYLRQQLPHAEIYCAAVLQMLNCQQIHELYEWSNKHKLRLYHQFLRNPNSLQFSVLDQNERDKLVDLLMSKQQQKYFIAKPQRIVIDNLITAIKQIEFDYGHRSQCIELLSKLCAHRKITDLQIRKQLGVLTHLADELINRIHVIKSTFVLQQKSV
jgi:sulfatase maturation enzyme AslB (radical SAM superfamily)